MLIENFNWKKIEVTFLPYAFFVIFICFLLGYQLSHHNTLVMGDGYFHFSRFYDAAQQIKNNNFSYFQTNWGFDQSGRIINAMYGPFFAYIMGSLLLLTGTWFKFQIISTFIIDFITLIGIYKVLFSLTKDRKLSTLMSCVYICINRTWNNGASFGSISSMLMPFILICGIKMIQNRSNPINSIQLAVVISVSAQVHLMTTFLGVIMLIFFFGAGLVRTHHKRMIDQLVLAFIITLILTVNIWIGLIYFHTQENLANPLGMQLIDNTFKLKDYPLSVTFLGVFQLIYISFNFKRTFINTFLTCVGLFFFIISSSFFPWAFFQTHYPVLKEVFQVPRRLALIVIPLLVGGATLSISSIINKYDKLKLLSEGMTLLVLLSVFNAAVRTNTFYCDTANYNQPLQKILYKSKLQKLFYYLNVPAPDYLPVTQNISGEERVKLYKRDVVATTSSFNHQVKKNGKLVLIWKANDSDKTKLPVVMYRNSSLYVNGNKTEPKLNAIGVPLIKQKIGKNTAMLEYNTPSWWSMVFCVLMCSWLFLALDLIVKLINKLKDELMNGNDG